MRSRRGWSIKGRLSLTLAAVALGIFGLGGTLQNSFLRADFKSVILSQQDSEVSRLAGEIDAKFATAIAVLRETAATFSPGDLGDARAVREELRTQPALHAMFDDLLLLGPDGVIRVDWPPVKGGRASTPRTGNSSTK